MKQPASRTDELLQALADAPVPAEDGARQRERREQVVARLSSVLREERRATERRRKRRPLAAAILAAACVLLALGAWRTLRTPPQLAGLPAAVTAPSGTRVRAMEGTVLVARDGRLDPVTTSDDLALRDGDELRTAAQARATMVLGSGVLVDVGPGTSLSVGASRELAPEGREQILVTLGRVELTVPKLAVGHSFAVRTPDAEVVVHGTRFSVTVVAAASSEPTTTSVQVTEGRVSVTHAGSETVLLRGDSWSSEPSSPATPAAEGLNPASAASGVSPLRPGATEPHGNTSASPSTDNTPPSSLAEENRLFQSAMEARRRGEDRRVVALLDELLLRHPTSPLAQNARVERFRALKRLGDDTAAAREARRYLAENPDGFARDEARDTVLTPSPSSSPSH